MQSSTMRITSVKTFELARGRSSMWQKSSSATMPSHSQACVMPAMVEMTYCLNREKFSRASVMVARTRNRATFPSLASVCSAGSSRMAAYL